MSINCEYPISKRTRRRVAEKNFYVKYQNSRWSSSPSLSDMLESWMRQIFRSLVGGLSVVCHWNCHQQITPLMPQLRVLFIVESFYSWIGSIAVQLTINCLAFDFWFGGISIGKAFATETGSYSEFWVGKEGFFLGKSKWGILLKMCVLKCFIRKGDDLP